MDEQRILEEGLAHHQAGRLGEAETLYRRVLADNPNNADALHFLGLLAHQAGRSDAAAQLIRRAIGLEDARPTFHFNLGAALAAMGDLEAAARAYARSAGLDAGRAEVHGDLGTVLGRLGRLAEAEAAFRRALELDPDHVPALAGLGAALNAQGRAEAAAEASRAAIGLQPDLAEAHTNLGKSLDMLGRLGEAEASHRRALALDPDYAIARCNLGNALGGLHRQDEAEACYRRAVALDPHYDDAWDNLLLQLLYAPQSDAARLYAEHRAWGADFEAGLPPAQPHANPPDAERRLKVGYLSADFRTHSCAYFTEPLFAAHDRKRVEVFAYAQLRRADHVTARFQALADHWAEVAALDDAALARLIREDGIDVLVDLGGHTRDNRLRVLARRPAPVQVSWLGYPATTGLEAVEYRLTDALADPPGAADGTHAEELVRLEGGFLCYRPPADAPPVSPPPLDETGAVTFASFNNIAKVSEPALDAWAAILAAIPDARLVVKGSALDQPPVRRRIQADFETRGIAAERVGLKGWIARAEAPLALYHEADIALDSLPYNGTTTSCEALWMGLPVISLAGTHHAARVGASLLAQVGLGELMAESEADYVRIAVELARAPARIRAYRKELRARLRASPLMDEAGFARRVEAAYATLWRRWCASQNQG